MAFKLLNCVYFDALVFSFLAWMLSLYCCSSYKNWSIGRLICFLMLPAISSYRGSSRKEIISLFRYSYKLGVLLWQNHIFFRDGGNHFIFIPTSAGFCPSGFIIFGQQKSCAPIRILLIQTSHRGWSTAKNMGKIL